MTPSPAIDGLSPSHLADAVVSESLTSFLAHYGDTHLLLVRIGGGDTDLALGLSSTAVQGGEGIRVQAIRGSSIEFHTVHGMSSVPPAKRPRRPSNDPASLVSLLESAQYFALPLRKRRDMDVLFADRISVGRAANKDIVLRHPSVSKFHAWFELDEAGGFQVSDAGSKNRTRVNGEKIPPRERRRVNSGDVIRFGSVECVLCSPQILWSAMDLVGGAAHG